MRPEKQAIQKELVAHLEAANYAFLLNYAGLSVAALSELRRTAKLHKARVQVVKNSQLDKAVTALGWESVAAFLPGPTALITGAGDAAEMAKTLMVFVKAHAKAAVKGVCLDGQALGAAEVEALATLPPRLVMLGQFVGTLAAPMMGLVGVFNQKVLSLLYVLKAVEEKKSKAA